jgi:hypothetical protein
MSLIMKRASFASQEGGAAKRQRVLSIAEVKEELNAAGLCQPTLSLLEDAINGSIANTHHLRQRGQASMDEREPAPLKRHRTCSQLLPIQTCEMDVRVQTGIAPPFSISAYPGSAANGTIMPYRTEYHRRLASWSPRNIMFVSSDCTLTAELPEELRPVMRLACGRLVEVAKAGLDSRGVAYLWGEDGELLASMPPVCQDDDRLSNGAQIQFLSQGGQGDSNAMLTCSQGPCTDDTDESSVQNTDTIWAAQKDCEIEEEFSPSTTVPDSPDCDMDTD